MFKLNFGNTIALHNNQTYIRTFCIFCSRSNTCPLCTKSNPKPHRLFLDLTAAAESKPDNGSCNENVVIIRGIPARQLREPPLAIVLKLSSMMGLSMRQSDIRNVTKKFKNLHVNFYTARQMEMFMENKGLLKANQEMSRVKLHENLNEETKELFNYAHKLKSFNYKILYVRNKKIYARKTQQDTPVYICSKEQVDTLCADTGNTRTNQVANPSASLANRSSVNRRSNRSANVSGSHQTERTTANLTTRTTVANNLATEVSRNTSASSSSSFNRATAPPNNLVNATTSPTHQNAAASARTYYAPTAPALGSMQSMDRDSAVLIRQIILEDFIDADASPNRDSMTGVLRQPDNNINNRQQTKTFKTSILSVFKKITKTFKKS